tara:strand:- start:14730 stop:15701 length:972 start_codon:yes stop_codon:yes gene_type:complete
MKLTGKLPPEVIELMAQQLTAYVPVKGVINESSEETRLAFIFKDNDELSNAISGVLFNKRYDVDEELTIEQQNEFNLYQLFFKGIGESHFYFNESALIEDIRESVTLNDYCQRDHAYQQKAIAKEMDDYKEKPYYFSCDYWIRYINKTHELVYATLRSADRELYWQLEALSTELIDEAIEHTIEMLPSKINISEHQKKESTPYDIIVDANGKEQQLAQLQKYCRTCINELTSTYAKQVASDAPSISMRFEVDECTDQYCTFVVNNEQAAKQIHLRTFEKSVTDFGVPAQNIHQQHEKVLNKFTCLFAEKMKMLTKENEDNVHE